MDRRAGRLGLSGREAAEMSPQREAEALVSGVRT